MRFGSDSSRAGPSSSTVKAEESMDENTSSSSSGGTLDERKQSGTEAFSKNIEKMKDRKAIREWRNWQDEVMPSLIEGILYSRDRFMIDQVLKQCSAPADGGGDGGAGGKTVKIVLVVGIAHMDGIEEILESEFGIEKVKYQG